MSTTVYSIGNRIRFSGPTTVKSVKNMIDLIEIKINSHFKKSSNKLTITYVIDSTGGGMIEVFKFINFIIESKEKHPSLRYESIITGSTAGSGTIMAIAADRRMISHEAHAMICKIDTHVNGRLGDMVRHKNFLKQIHHKMIQIYSYISRIEYDKVEEMMKNGQWFNPTKYLEFGFVNEIV